MEKEREKEKEIDKLKRLKKALEDNNTIEAFNLVEQIKEEEVKKNYPSLRRFDFTLKPEFARCEFVDYFRIAKECLE